MIVTTVFSFRKETWELHAHGRSNFIVGDSGTGKTFLVSSINEYYRGHGEVPVGSNGYRLYTFENKALLRQLPETDRRKSILVVDEGDVSLLLLEYETLHDAVKSLGCYVVFALRSLPADLPFGVEDVYYMANSNHYHTMRPVLDRRDDLFDVDSLPVNVLVCEDGKSGYSLMRYIYGSRIDIKSSKGNDSLMRWVSKNKTPSVLYLDLCGLGDATLKLVECKHSRSLRVIYSLSFERDVLNNKAFASLFGVWDPFSSDTVSEEVFYVTELTRLMKIVFGCNYSKGSTDWIKYISRDRSWIPKITVASDCTLIHSPLKRMEL